MAKLVSKTYSKALFEVAQESNSLEQMLKEFEFVVESFKAYPEFFEIIKSPKVNPANKHQVFDDTFKGKVSAELLNFFKLLVDKKRVSYIVDIFKEFKIAANEHLGIVIAKVESVVALEKKEVSELEKKLNVLTGKTVTVNNVINPDIMGGLIVKVGDKIIDGSIKNKLENLKGDLAQIII